MSGGAYEYVYSHIEEAASVLRSRHPEEPHVLALAAHLNALAKVMQDIEWADSNDTAWDAELDAAIRAVLHPGAEMVVATARAIMAREQLDALLQRTPLAFAPLNQNGDATITIQPAEGP